MTIKMSNGDIYKPITNEIIDYKGVMFLRVEVEVFKCNGMTKVIKLLNVSHIIEMEND